MRRSPSFRGPRFVLVVVGVLLVGGLSASTLGATIGLDLSYVDTQSVAWQRFVAWVDQALDGTPPYGFTATDAVTVYRVTGQSAYAQLAIATVEAQVSEAEGFIAIGQVPPIAGDQYLESGPWIHDVALVYAWCYPVLTAQQRSRWAAYAEQTVWNLWHHGQASWGGVAHPWPGWGVDDPGNNYHFSFLEATMFWGLASDGPTWLALLEDEKLPALTAYWAQLSGGGSREGTGYGLALMRLFELYRLWRDSTGVDLGVSSSHLADTIDYWIHATVPTLDRYAPIGDLARESYPWLYDYHRRLVLEARAMAVAPAVRERASWWLHHIAIDEMTSGFNLRHDLLPAGVTETAPTALVHHAVGAGHLFARTGWGSDATWMSFVAGRYDQSHAHQDQGSFNLFHGDFLAVSEYVFSHSGIEQGTEQHNLVRFDRAGVPITQLPGTTSSLAVQAGASWTRLVADLTAAYGAGRGVNLWQRTVELSGTGLLLDDRFVVDPDVEAVFQLNLPVEPTISGGVVTVPGFRLVPLLPRGATATVVSWHTVDPQEYSTGWRLELRGAGSRFAVRLLLPGVLQVDGFETGGLEAWPAQRP